MALALKVVITVNDTEPAVPGNPGIIVASERATTLTTDGDASAEAIWILAEAKLGGLVEDVSGDITMQCEIAQKNAREGKFNR